MKQDYAKFEDKISIPGDTDRFKTVGLFLIILLCGVVL